MKPNTTVIESSKTFRNFPCAHRRFRHDGHCAWVHGYSRSFTLWFRTNEVTDNGFVMDFGKLKPVKAWLEDTFDHTLLLDTGDPLIPQFRAIEEQGGCKLVVYDDVGMEGTCAYVKDWVDRWLEAETGGRVWLHSVEVRENDKNSARLTLGSD
ncbi:MAG: 6-carboxytetrahydropterin synthase [Myxococcota bacterium]|nr:6-carboxytetrahydropterin synthase [Myxococcota bacterium]